MRRAGKFNAKPTVYNGVRYASRREAAVAQALDLRLKARGKNGVAAWSGQPKFPMVVNGHKICVYIADFLITYRDGTQAVWDVKGVETPAFRIKAKLYAALYPDGPPLVIVR